MPGLSASASSSTLLLRGCLLPACAYTASFSSFAGRNAIFLLALILMAAPVAGFRPILAARFRTWRMPRPVRRILSPLFRWRVVSVTKSPSTASACFFAISWLSANAAARCLSVMVACVADLAGVAFFAAVFLAEMAGMGFLAVLGVKSTGHGRPDSSNPNVAKPIRSPCLILQTA